MNVSIKRGNPGRGLAGNWALGFLALVALCGTVYAQDFQLQGGDMSPDRFDAYLATASDLVKVAPALNETVANATTLDAQTAAKDAVDKKITELAAAHKLSRADYERLFSQSLSAYDVMLAVDQYTDEKTKELDAQAKEYDAKFAAAKQKIATYTAAAKDGRRVMTDEQKAATTQAAAADKLTAIEQLREDTDTLAGANAAIKLHDQEVIAANDAKKNPPADVAALDAVSRASYFLQKNDEEDKARAAGDQARQTAADAQRNIDIDNAHIAADDAHVAHPDLPANAAEKDEISQTNASEIANAQADIDAATKFAGGLDGLRDKINQDVQTIARQVPDANLKLVRDHRDEYAQILAALGIETKPAYPAAPDNGAPDAGAPPPPP
jgi:hypothetical protein